MLSTVADGVSSFKKPKNLIKGSGKKGDAANSAGRAKPKASTGSGTGSSGVTSKNKVPLKQSNKIVGGAKNTLRMQRCEAAPGWGSTITQKICVIKSVEIGAKPTTLSNICSEQ